MNGDEKMHVAIAICITLIIMALVAGTAGYWIHFTAHCLDTGGSVVGPDCVRWRP